MGGGGVNRKGGVLLQEKRLPHGGLIRGGGLTARWGLIEILQ